LECAVVLDSGHFNQECATAMSTLDRGRVMVEIYSEYADCGSAPALFWYETVAGATKSLVVAAFSHMFCMIMSRYHCDAVEDNLRRTIVAPAMSY